MRVLVIGLDGLEYTIVHEGFYPHLKQREHGKVVVPISPSGEPISWAVWASFITGQPPAVHGIEKLARWDNPLFYRMRCFAMNKQLLLETLSTLKLARLLRLFDPEKAYPSLDDLRSKGITTIFDEVKPSIAVRVPVYNESLLEYVSGVAEAVGDEKLTEEYADKVFGYFLQERRTLFERLRDDWRLLMVHFHVSDAFGHVFYNKPQRVADLYTELDRTVHEAKNRLGGRDVWTLVVSDHGMLRGMHTLYGFYSSNKLLGLHLPHITDFYGLIMEMLKE